MVGFCRLTARRSQAPVEFTVFLPMLPWGFIPGQVKSPDSALQLLALAKTDVCTAQCLSSWMSIIHPRLAQSCSRVQNLLTLWILSQYVGNDTGRMCRTEDLSSTSTFSSFLNSGPIVTTHHLAPVNPQVSHLAGARPHKSFIVGKKKDKQLL